MSSIETSPENVHVDLHMHTNYSDGKFSPAELIDRALKAGLTVISITDHDNVNALPEAIEYSRDKGIEVIPGVELSADLNGREIHILGYFIDYKNTALREYLSKIREERLKRIEQMVTRLNNLGSKVTMEDVVKGLSSNISIGRPHIAKALVEQKFVRSYAEAFIKYIGDNKPAFVKKPNPPAREVVELISSIGGLSFLAHPGKIIRDEQLYEVISYGIDGIETIHPSHTKHDEKYFAEVAAQNFLLVSGGSDFHGIFSVDYENFGKYVIPAGSLMNMRRRLF
jgi:predicted metal-dependent phosphoesterase TrpH